MKIVSRAALVAAAVLASSAAMAQGTSGLYMEGRAGVTFLNEADNTSAGVNTSSARFDPGPNVAAAFGYADPSGFRGELELGYRVNEVDSVSSVNPLFLSARGNVSVFTALGNIYYDINTGGPWTPFVGGGAGIANINVDASFLGGSDSDSDTVIAYQAGAGIAYTLSPHWTFTLAYRYLATTDPKFSSPFFGSFESEYSSHNAIGGIRFTF